MRRFALLIPALLLSGCSGFLHFLNDTSGLTVNQNAPIGDSENMDRARGEAVDLKPLLTQPGDVWPGPPQPEPTLSDLQRMQASQGPRGLGNPNGAPPGSPMPGASAPGSPAPGSPAALTAPPSATVPPPMGGHGGAPSILATPSGPLKASPAPGGGFDVLKTPNGQNAGIAIPNGNGTSTIIAPNGTVTTVPTPK